MRTLRARERLCEPLIQICVTHGNKKNIYKRHPKNNKNTTFHSSPSGGWEHWNPEEIYGQIVVVLFKSSLFRSFL